MRQVLVRVRAPKPIPTGCFCGPWAQKQGLYMLAEPAVNKCACVSLLKCVSVLVSCVSMSVCLRRSVCVCVSVRVCARVCACAKVTSGQRISASAIYSVQLWM